MGKTSKAIFAGLGAGLSTVGAGLQRQEEVKREDARLEKLDEFRERELTVREKESKLNQQRMDIANKQAKWKFNLTRYNNALIAADGNAGDIANAMSNWIPDGKQYINRPGGNQTAIINPKTGELQVPHAIFDVGTYDSDANDETITGPDGKPIFKPLVIDGGQKIFWTKDEMMNFSSKPANADQWAAINFAERTAAQVRKLDADAVRQKAETVAGTELGRAEINLKKAQATKLRADAQATKSGKASKNIEAMAAKELAASLRKDFPGEPITPVTAGKMAAIRENPKTRRIFRRAAEAALDPDNPATRSDFIDGGTSEGIPQAFMEKLYEEAEIAYEERGEEAFASDGWFTEMYNKVVGLFSGGK